MKYLMKIFVMPIFVFGLVTGCDTFASGIAQTPEQRVFALKNDYQAVLVLLVQYESLPRCDQTENSVCSDSDIVKLMRSADNKAALTMNGAEEVVRSGRASESTIEFAIKAASTALEVLRQMLIDEGIV